MTRPAESLPLIIDVEASGFGAGSYPIEVGVALPDGTGRCFLVRPQPEWTHWDFQAESIHHISRDQLIENGLPVREAAELLNRWVDGRVAYSDGWGVDRSWLALLFSAARVHQHFNLETVRALLTERQAEAWGETRRKIARDMDLRRHRASTDARALQMTYQRVSQRLPRQTDS